MIAIVGSGNVATHLYKALKDRTEVCLVNPHSLEGLPSKADIILISVKDKAIGEVVNNLPGSNAIIAHTAGSVPMEILKGKSEHYGVFYPLQTFSKDIELNYSEIPVFIEGSTPETIKNLKETASLFSEKVLEADSQARKQLHLASVFACNFSNALAGIAQGILNESDLDFSVLIPLMKQTVDKLEKLSPKDAQTGPAVRGDIQIMENHLKMLQNQPLLQEIYSLLSSYIRKNHSIDSVSNSPNDHPENYPKQHM